MMLLGQAATLPWEPAIDLRIGPVEISRSLLASWGVAAGLVLSAWWIRRQLSVEQPSAAQHAVEALVEIADQQITEVVASDASPYLPLLLTLFLFILASNLVGVLPGGIYAPTADLAVTSALALIVAGAVPWFGIRRQGLRAYLVSYLKPSWLLLPLNLISELSRTLALSMRLFGNMMSGGVMTGVVAGLGALILAGLPVIVIGIPLRILAIFSGVVQAYIFVALALVFIGAAVRGQPKPEAISREASHG